MTNRRKTLGRRLLRLGRHEGSSPPAPMAEDKEHREVQPFMSEIKEMAMRDKEAITEYGQVHPGAADITDE